jgi:dihydroflavonol-4-reductase
MTLDKNSKRKALVTGATGFVGGWLVDLLLRKGCQVTCLVRKAGNSQALQQIPVRLVIGDLENRKAIRDAAQGIDTVYHVAGTIKATNREEYFRINQLGTRSLLETLAEAAPGLKRFIHISSLAAAGPSLGEHGLTEEDKPNPISWYGESKLQSEQEALKFAKSFRVTILRPSAVYGPRDRETLMIFRMIKRGCLFTPGRFIRRFSLIHVNDLAAAIVKAGEQDISSGEIFFISRRESYTWEEVGRAIARALGRNYRQIAIPKSIAVMAGHAGDLWNSMSRKPATLNTEKIKELLQPSWLCNPSKAWTLLGLTPEIDLVRGMEDTVGWYRTHGWL